MAGILSGLYHAPLTSIFLIAEITGGYSLMLPLMIVSSISFAVSKYFEPFSMDAKNLAKKGETFTTDKDFNVLTTIKTNELVEKDYPLLSPFSTLRTLVEVVSQSKRNIFPVTDKNGNLMGMVLLDDIREIMFKPDSYDSVQIKELMRMPLAIIQVDENMNHVMKYFDETGAWILPVVKDYKFVGFISKSNVFSGYRDKLKDHTIE
jgi:CIC family chloride channel protein